MVRYPLGGMMSWVLQYLTGFRALGHDVVFVEAADRPDACYDPVRGEMTDDPAAGARAVDELLRSVGLDGRWCFRDVHGQHHGMGRQAVQRAFDRADVFVDMGTHGQFHEQAAKSGLRVLVDGEPGFTQVKMQARADGPEYDAYFTTGRNIGTAASCAPSAGRRWRPIFHPVDTSLIGPRPLPDGGAFTTVMNWRSHAPVPWRGGVLRHKDAELPRFIALPERSPYPLEVAFAGPAERAAELRACGWRVRHGHRTTRSVAAFCDYVAASAGEFGVCKHAFVVTNSGWFSDRSAAYLASGRPVVLQETGFSAHLPCGEGLFSVRDVDEATAALEEIAAAPARHAVAARAVAEEHLAASRVLAQFLDELGVA